MQVSCQRTLCIEIYKTMNNLGKSTIYEKFLQIQIAALTFGSNSLESVGFTSFTEVPILLR